MSDRQQIKSSTYAIVMMLRLSKAFEDMSNICRSAMLDFTRDMNLNENYQKLKQQKEMKQQNYQRKNKYRIAEEQKIQIPLKNKKIKQNKIKRTKPKYQDYTEEESIQQRTPQFEQSNSGSEIKDLNNSPPSSSPYLPTRQKTQKKQNIQTSKKVKRTYKGKVEIQPQTKKKSCNGFMRFYKEVRQLLKQHYQTNQSKQLSKLAGIQWRKLTIDEQNRYNQLYLDEKEQIQKNLSVSEKSKKQIKSIKNKEYRDRIKRSMNKQVDYSVNPNFQADRVNNKVSSESQSQQNEQDESYQSSQVRNKQSQQQQKIQLQQQQLIYAYKHKQSGKQSKLHHKQGKNTPSKSPSN